MMPRLTLILAAASLLLVFPGSVSPWKHTAGRAVQESEAPCHSINCQKIANAAFEAEMAREGKDCKGVTNQLEENSCENEAAEATERNFFTFYEALEGIIGNSTLDQSEQT